MYIGVTNDLERLVVEHKSGICDGFTKRYHASKLVLAKSNFYINF